MSEQIDNDILYRWQGGQPMRGIARDLKVSRWRVKRVIQRQQAAREDPSAGPVNSQLPRPVVSRASKLDAFATSLDQLLQRYPKITVTRLWEELKKGRIRRRLYDSS